MDKIKELEDLLRNDVLVEVNGTINELSNKKGKDAKSSREDIISLNGRVLPKEEKQNG